MKSGIFALVASAPLLARHSRLARDAENPPPMDDDSALIAVVHLSLQTG